MGLRRKQLSFDLDTDICKKILGDEKYTKAYKDIRTFFERNGCLHIEGSVYMSNHRLGNVDVARLVGKLLKEHPYLSKCIREIHQADVSSVHSLNQYFSYDGTPGQYEQQENKVEGHKREPPDKPSVRRRLEENKERVKRNEQNSNRGDRANSHHNRDER